MSEQCEHVGWPDNLMSVCLARSQLGTSLAWQTQLPAAMADDTSLLNQAHVHCAVPQLQLISSPLLFKPLSPLSYKHYSHSFATQVVSFTTPF